MKTALGLYARSVYKQLEGKDSEKFDEISYILDLPIDHYCYSKDESRTTKGFKYEQVYYLNGSDIKAVTKRFEDLF